MRHLCIHAVFISTHKILFISFDEAKNMYLRFYRKNIIFDLKITFYFVFFSFLVRETFFF